MPMARTGIYFTLKALISPGEKVILSPYTIADVVNMVVCAGGVPVFADIEKTTCNISPESVESLIDDRTGAVLVTHFYGLACDMEAINTICGQAGVPVVEDAAQAFGGRRGNGFLGSIGRAGVFSFGIYKNINSLLGGLVVTDDDELASKLKEQLRDLPSQPKLPYLAKTLSALTIDAVTYPPIFANLFFPLFRYAFLNHIDPINDRLKIDTDPELKTTIPMSYTCRMSEVQAKMVLGQLDQVESDIRLRIETAKCYHDGLHDIDDLTLPPSREDFSHSYWYYPIQYGNRSDLVAHLMRHGRDVTMSYHRNCADLSCFSNWKRDCPVAREVADAVIYLPTYPRYTRAEVNMTIAAIRSYFKR